MNKTLQIALSALLTAFVFSNTTAQEHAFTTYNAGTLSSGTSGITTPMNVSGVSGTYLIYTVHADFNGLGNTAWSNSIEMELSNGGSVIYASLANAKSGSMANANATTLSWTGVMERPYSGGGSFSVRFFDDYHDASGPYTCSLTNVRVTIYEASVSHTFSTFNAGTVVSNTTGQETALTGAIAGNSYLFYSVSADFVGTGNPAWSNSINMELNGGSGTIYKPESLALSGSQSSAAATTLRWTGIMIQPHVGGGTLNVRFFDDYHDASGPYSSNITNVQVTIYEVTEVHSFAAYNPATLLSNTTGVSTAMPVSGLSDDYLFYNLEANWVGTGNPAWSNSMQLELNNGGSKVFSNLALPMVGSMSNPNATVLKWTGVMNDIYAGGDPLTVRLFDDYDDASGPYSSSYTNVRLTIYTPAQCPTTTSTFSVARCGTYTVPSGDETYTSSGTYMDTIPNAAGCDSIMTINVYIDEVPNITHFTGREVDQFRVRWEYLLPVTINDTNFRIRAWESGFPLAYTDKSQFPGNFQKKFTGLDDNTWYKVKVGFACEDGSFVWSGTDSVRTRKIPCPDVTGQTQDQPYSTSTATVRWNDGGADSYKIRFRASGTTDWSFRSVTDTSLYLAGLFESSYEYQVKAQCSNGLESSYGSSNSIVTQGGAGRLSAQNGDGIELYPNPANERLNLIIPAQQARSVQLKLTDMTGRVVIEETHLLIEGVNALQLQLDNLNASVYLLQLIDNGRIDTFRVVKE